MKKWMPLALILFMMLETAALAAPVKISITAGGDIVLGGDKAKKTDVRFEQLVKQYGDGYVLKNLLPLFTTDDITILNLEGPLKYSKRPRIPARPFHLYGKPEYARILTAGSVEVVNVVNNHIHGYNTKPETLNILKQNGIIRSDGKFNLENNSVTVRGVRVGFIGYQTPWSTKRIREDIKEIKLKCDVAVVSFHFGEVPEHTNAIRASQVRAAHAAVDAGADLVLGHHPHVVSGIELYKDKYIFYDLGAVESTGKNFKYHNMVARIVLEVDKAAGTIVTHKPIVYPGFSTGAGRAQDNNCQPILWKPGEDGYEQVFSIIDRESKYKGITPGPYVRGA